MSFQTFIHPSELFRIYLEPEVVVIDTRFWLDDTNKGQTDYLEAHIPGAIYAHLDNDLSGDVVQGKTGRHPLPDPMEFATLVSSWGVSNVTQVIAYDDRGGAIAGRLWWLMRWIGNKNIAVLNGGFPAWENAGYPVSTEIPTPEVGSFIYHLDEKNLATSRKETAWTG